MLGKKTFCKNIPDQTFRKFLNHKIALSGLVQINSFYLLIYVYSTTIAVLGGSELSCCRMFVCKIYHQLSEIAGFLVGHLASIPF